MSLDLENLVAIDTHVHASASVATQVAYRVVTSTGASSGKVMNHAASRASRATRR